MGTCTGKQHKQKQQEAQRMEQTITNSTRHSPSLKFTIYDTSIQRIIIVPELQKQISQSSIMLRRSRQQAKSL
ncbi:hypothetical protein pb186bvf_007807 [Paramecium bursaria]